MEPRSTPGPAHDDADAITRRAHRPVIDGALDPDILILDSRWHRLVPDAERWIRRAAHAAGGAGAVVLDSDRRVKALNARHRGRNKPTNVLTFEPPPGFPGGDIILAFETVRDEALAKGWRPAHHLAHLVVHGALHLRGDDHHLAGEARRMEMRETRILHRLGVPNPWRTGGSVRP
ncbi:putative rRNA maturation factor [Endobacter medicaginis]|uniref:Endoribonuclease YbeY n=1 Tax=Endobacter medicaginis TaxID=1181271 RepID=A0A839UYU1_9PROT|nr:rRNA maturation RNase YbeY [Endobacter medicaginis]MBB3172552.1 putative rRNA maturation factor [Endobacter medicaginis]MCX5473960.1 rRNA maturation RNase YbeY [Endobacter medicaginis]NVN30162.1 rRNA maturation RNase YbeY [Endobacter medicaginis]